MDYEKKYKEALGWMQEMYPCLTDSLREDAEHFFPELAESEDERIRKELIEYLTHKAEVTPFIDEDKDCKRWIAYLEKQKEQKPELCDMGRWDEESYNNGIHHVLQNPEAYGLTKQKPAEWSEEDESKKERLISIVKRALHGNEYPILNDDGATELIAWLKSLRPQPHWKPSMEVDLEKLGEIARHIIAVKQNVEDMRLNKDEWSLLERIGYPERFNARKEK